MSDNFGLGDGITISFRVEGEAKGTPRTSPNGRGKKARLYTPSTANYWKSCVADAARKAGLPRFIDGPIRVDICFLFQMPVSKRKKKWIQENRRVPMIVKPDRDNADKAVLDTLVSMGVLADDARVFDGRITKLYAAPDEVPGAEITITYWP
jgi:Holliday junction resolvase RusA-like endonuclease